MRASETVTQLVASRIVAVVRAPSADSAIQICHALAAGGVKAVELTFTIPDALAVIETAREALPDDVILGAGTVLDPETARSAILAGADFVVSPVLNLDLIRLCKRYDKAVMPGAFTPTEILTAWEHGADIVKVFPADVGGPDYFKAIRGPLPQIRLMPTGGVTLDTAKAFLDAGACALGAGGSLVPSSAVASGDFRRITDLARQFASIVAESNGS